ncbi:MAG: transglutaminase domain-containing protein [Caldilineales bacterium]|nr:transglutaminase domain-containing protein [Caldilineales bacterium]
MSSRIFLAFCVLVALAACQPAQPDEAFIQPTDIPPTDQQARTFAVTEHLRVVNYGPGMPEKQNLWVALISDAGPFQRVISMEIEPEPNAFITDEYGNRYAEFDLSSQPMGDVPIQIIYQVEVQPAATDLSQCVGDMPNDFTHAELHIESDNPQIVALAEYLTEGKEDPCEKVRAFYDYVGDNLVYTYNGRDWGAQAALGPMGADCTEYSDLMIALNRAAGIPARYVEGVLYLEEGEESLARTEHAWVEVYLPGSGWTPFDPTLGRSSITRDRYFAALPADHIVVTRGRNPSPLRGGSYFSHLYWPGDSTAIRIEDFGWAIEAVG